MKHRLNYSEVYITNVCNYSCTHCQSLNNFAFKGHQLWSDYQKDYELLSTRIDIDQLQIIGGEPTLNPDFEKWVYGLSNLWPKTKLQISTNGSRLDKLDKNIYQVLLKHKGTLWITCHDIELYDSLLKFSKQFLDEIVSDHNPDQHGLDNWKTTYDTIKQDSWPDCEQIDYFVNLPTNIKQEFIKAHRSDSELSLKSVSRMLIDKNGVEIKLDWSQTFVSSAVKVTEDQRLKLKYNSDVVKAHTSCYFKTCHQLNKGKLYKCPLVSVLPDFLNQFEIDIDDENKKLAIEYKPITGIDSDETISTFIADIDKPIPQCKFCPVNYDKYNFVGSDKKIKINVVGRSGEIRTPDSLFRRQVL